MITPDSGSLSLVGNAPQLVIDTRIVPGGAKLNLHAARALVEVDTESLLSDLPYMLSTFSERRAVIRQTLDEVRDVVMQGRDTEIYLTFELDGLLFDAAQFSKIELECLNSDGTTALNFNSTDNAAMFDFSRRIVVRGQEITALVIILNPATVGLFAADLWTVDVFGTDADHSTGAHWVTLEWEVRSLFEGSFITPLTGSLDFETDAPTVIYRNIKPDTAELALTGYAPVLAGSTRIVPSTGSVGITGVAAIRTP